MQHGAYTFRMNASIAATRMTFAVDCPDALGLATFYAALLGWDVVVDEASESDPEWVEVHPPGGEGATHFLAFQRVADYRVPEWPNGATPQQAHLDFYVADLQEAAATAASLGAHRHAVQPSESGSFIVFTDPAGHPFCLCADSN